MTWVSTYLAFMGLEGLMNVLSDYDLGVLSHSVISPVSFITDQDSIEVIINVANCGLNRITGGFSVSSSGTPLFSDDLSLDFAKRQTYSLKLPPQPAGTARLQFVASSPSDFNTANDTITVLLEILPVNMVQISVTDSFSNPVPCSINIIRILPDTSYLCSSMTSSLGDFSIELPGTYYRLEFTCEYPFPKWTIDSVMFSFDEIYSATIPKAYVMLVDDDGGQNYEQFVAQALDTLGVLYHIVDRSERIIESSMINDFTRNTIIWMTGNDSIGTLTENDILAITEILEGGAYVIIVVNIYPMNSGNTRF
jgi:hypothetical protein